MNQLRHQLARITRSMRLHDGLPKTFWADAVSTAAYLINRGPSIPMEFKLPEKVWSGKEVKFSHLKVFGCVSYVHIDSDARSKLDAKSKICFFIGYGDEKLSYRGEEDKENVNSQVDLSTPVVEVRRSSRNIRPPQRYSPVLNYLLLTDGGEPECYDEALQDENSSKWELAMKDEMDSLLGNQTWELTELPVGKKALHNNCEDVNNQTCTGMVAAENLDLEQLNVKTAFLHGSGIEEINNLKKQLSKQFAMKDLGAAKQILGMRIIRDKANGTLKLSQSESMKKVLSRFNMNEAKPVSTPLGSHFKLSKEQSPKTEEERNNMSKVPYASAIGSLMYAMVCTRSDIAHAVGIVSRFMSRPGKQHWEAVKWILRYLKGSLDACLCFTGGTTISWASNLQKIVTLSTIEAEYVAAIEAGKEMIWLHGFLDELGKKQEIGILHSVSQSAIFLAKNSAFHSKSKHIQTKYHFIRYIVEDKLVILEKICGSKNPADMLTKGVTIEKLKLCAASIGFLA
ncbi:Retrovirus-related Pol polyprotein from transposon TNT 1-94 [Vitis vinifera]|uniref:Retrovirus-related Pol polyprotein from transposon TNT 1-94 n=1 Tax=Vitis vinifera TaxID=29760 RepID=A0A438D583_VITVI|nr:Retrovirus-related Pol polyprotein from transposon TNT 1-94 [Vitis vinifera]